MKDDKLKKKAYREATFLAREQQVQDKGDFRKLYRHCLKRLMRRKTDAGMQTT